MPHTANADPVTARRRARLQAASALAALLTVALALGLLAGVLVVAVQNNRLSDTIRGCLEPTGECYMRSTQRQDERTVQTRRIVVASAYCASILPRPEQQQLAACVEKVLAQPPPAPAPPSVTMPAPTPSGVPSPP